MPDGEIENMFLKKIHEKNIYKKGFFHIFGSSVFNKFFSFLSGFVLVRVLSKTDYGVYTYAVNILSFFMLLNGLGMNSATLQICSEQKDEKKKLLIFRVGFWWAVVFNVLLTMAVFIWAAYGNVQFQEARLLLALLGSTIVLSVVFEMMQVYYRYTLQNKLFSYMNTMNSIIISLSSIVGAIRYGSVGLVVGTNIGWVLSLVGAIVFFHFPIREIFGKILLRGEKHIFLDLFSIGGISMINIATGKLLYLIDLYVVGKVLTDSVALANYKAATMIPDALLFIPSALMIYYYPIFAQNKDDIKWVGKKYFDILKCFGLFNIIIVGVLVLIGKTIIDILFGEQYTDIFETFRILCIAYVFSATFRKVTGNILASQRKLFINLVIGVFEGVVNLGLNYYFVLNYGAMGAAYATLITSIIFSVVNIWYMVSYLNKKRRGLYGER